VVAAPAPAAAGGGRADGGAPPARAAEPAAAAEPAIPAPERAPRAAAPVPPPAPVPTATPAAVATLPAADGVSSGLRQVAQAAAVTLADMEEVARLSVPPAIYDQRLQHAEVVVQGLAFERDPAGAEVRAAVDEILGYYRTAREIRTTQRELDERRDRRQRTRSSTAVPYFSDGPVPQWVAR
jgi:hypothetical protein